MKKTHMWRCLAPTMEKLLRVLKLSLILILVFSLQLSGKSLVQRVHLKSNDISIRDVLKELKKQTGYYFMFSEDEVDKSITVDVDLKNATLEEALQYVFDDLPFEYNIKDDIVLIKKKAPTPVNVQQDKHTITVKGIVTDEEGEPLPGAAIVIKGTTKGVTTGFDGAYNFPDVPEDAILECSFIGFVIKEQVLNGRSHLNWVLKSSISELDDVTVVAFGKQKKESVLASIETVAVAELQVPTSNLTTALAGRVSGLISYQRSGEPGQDNAEFFIRGATTFGYKTDPLILIDGIELGSDDLARLNPDDVQSFSIMKDATATALYGARGANGVILITTKEGKEGKAKISARLERSISMATKEIDLASPIDYMLLNNEAVRTRNPLEFLPYTESKIGHTTAGTNQYVYPANDWRDMLFKDATTNTRFNMNVSGGGKVAQYYIAMSANQDNGILEVDDRNNFNNNIKLNKYLLRSNVNIKINPTTKMKVRLHGTFDDYTGPIDGGGTIYQKSMRTSPVDFPAYYAPDENNIYTNHILFGNAAEELMINPYADLTKGYKEYSETLVLAQIELEEDLKWITEGLKFRILGNTTRYSFFDVKRKYNPFYYSHGLYDMTSDTYSLVNLNPDEGTEYLDYEGGEPVVTSSMYLESALNYSKVIADAHELSGMLVFMMNDKRRSDQDDLQNSLPNRNLGISGRFTYAFDSRYFAEFNFGYNGSERFDKKNRFGFFPAAGLGWIVSNESFFEGMKNTVSKLKLKATYGLVGNDAIGDSDDRFFYLSNVEMNSGDRWASFGDTNGYGKNGVKVTRYANSDITWEIAHKLNLGLEFSLWDKLSIQADYFTENRTNILMSRIIPSAQGIQAAVRANVGEAYSHGTDISVDYQAFFKDDFWITARGNFTYATGRYKVAEEPDYSETPWRSKIDQPINQTYGYIAERLFVDDFEVANSPVQDFGQEVLAGDIKYRDVNGDGKITELDKVPIGHPTSPEITYGFGVSIGYKAFDCSFFFQGNARTSFWIDPQTTAPFVDYNSSSVTWDDNILTKNALLQVIADNHWSEANRDVYALWPRLDASNNANNTQKSTWYMQDGSFLRLKSLELGYSLPKKLIKKINMEKFRVYASGTNLMHWSKFKLWDPEMAGNGLGYPIQRVFNLGLNIAF